MINRIIFAVILVCWAVGLSAQQPQHEQTNAGTDFWVTSMHKAQGLYNYGNPESNHPDSIHADIYIQMTQSNWYSDRDTATLQIVGLEGCSGYVTNPSTGWRADFQVVPGSVTEIKVPEAQIMCYETPEIQHKGCHIHTECDVWAYLISNQNFTYPPSPAQNNLTKLERDVSKIQLTPVQSYQNEYYIQNCYWTCGVGGLPTYFIVATEDQTLVTVPSHWEDRSVMPDQFLEDIHYVEEQSFLLNAGDVLTICSMVCDPSFDLSNVAYLPIRTDCKPVVLYQSVADFCFSIGNLDRRVIDLPFNVYNQKGSGKDFVWLHTNPYEGGIFLFSPVCNGVITSTGSNSSPAPAMTYDFLGNGVQYLFLNHNLPHFHHIHQSNCAASLECEFNREGAIPSYPAADRRVKEVVMPTRKDTLSDRMKMILTICVPPEGIHSTYLNGDLIPIDEYLTRWEISDRYYLANVVYYNEDIPPLLHITNPFGFSAILQEISYDTTSRDVNQWTMHGSGCTYDNFNFNDTLHACIGDTLLLTTYLDCGYNPLTWVVNGTEYQQDSLFFPVEAVDTLAVMLIEDNFCRPDTSYGIVYTSGMPHITLPADTFICPGATITAQCDVFGFWQWSDGTEGATFTPQTEGDYTVYIVNDCGTDSATVHVRLYNALYVDFGPDTLLCELATLLLDATQQHPASYLWQDASTNTTYTVIDDGSYWVVVTDGCTGTSDTIDVTYLYDLQIDLGRDTTICYTHPYMLDVTRPFSHYLWHDGTTAPVHWVDMSGTYSVHVYNACTEADASVTVEVEECEEAVHVPNAFTPDGDGQNEVFLPVFNHPERLESYSMQVYDRWGRLLFGTENLHQGWDGRGCPTGTYVWRMEYKAAGEKPQLLTGSVTVVR